MQKDIFNARTLSAWFNMKMKFVSVVAVNQSHALKSRIPEIIENYCEFCDLKNAMLFKMVRTVTQNGGAIVWRGLLMNTEAGKQMKKSNE